MPSYHQTNKTLAKPLSSLWKLVNEGTADLGVIQHGAGP